MICGQDAADKDGVRRYEGCGKSFSWERAPAYEVSIAFREPEVPVTLHVEALRQHRPPVTCCECRQEVLGTAFWCIHCKDTPTTCWSCLRKFLVFDHDAAVSELSEASVQCPACTFLNARGATHCEICLGDLPEPNRGLDAVDKVR